MSGINIQFATCERHRALGFLRKLYPSSEIKDTQEDAAPFLDLVAADVFRVPDPDMHGSRVGLIPSKNWDESRRDEFISVVQKFHDLHTES